MKNIKGCMLKNTNNLQYRIMQNIPAIKDRAFNFGPETFLRMEE